VSRARRAEAGRVPAVLLAALGAAAVLTAGARIAHAGCHGSGGGSGGGGGGGGGRGGGHGSVSSRACADDSDVVGLRHCTGFAAWARDLHYPHLIIEAGAMVRQFGSLLDHQTGSVSHGAESFAYRVVQSGTTRRARDTAVLSTMRASLVLSRAVYSGVEVDLGGLAQPGAAQTEMMSTGAFGSPELAQQHGLIVDTLGLVGVHGSVGPAGIGVELAGGVRAVSYGFHSSYHDCQGSTSISAVGTVGEARARGELWLSPWITAGAVVGTSVLERGAWMGGLYLGFHSRAFGGDR
jgi:hypothetical protein